MHREMSITDRSLRIVRRSTTTLPTDVFHADPVASSARPPDPPTQRLPSATPARFLQGLSQNSQVSRITKTQGLPTAYEPYQGRRKYHTVGTKAGIGPARIILGVTGTGTVC